VAGAARVRLHARVADLWLWPEPVLEARAAHLLAALHPSERAPDRRRSLGRAALRVMLSRHLGCAPARLEIRRHCPYCDRPGHGPVTVPGLYASISYTAGLVAIAVADRPVGVDVERVRPGFDWQRVAHAVLERDDLDGVEAFFAAWTVREARGKARGLGLVEGPVAAPVEGPVDGAGIVRWRWGREHVGAVAVLDV
jgi:4'-phosphopantetheinyl transferase